MPPNNIIENMIKQIFQTLIKGLIVEPFQAIFKLPFEIMRQAIDRFAKIYREFCQKIFIFITCLFLLNFVFKRAQANWDHEIPQCLDHHKKGVQGLLLQIVFALLIDFDNKIQVNPQSAANKLRSIFPQISKYAFGNMISLEMLTLIRYLKDAYQQVIVDRKLTCALSQSNEIYIMHILVLSLPYYLMILCRIVMYQRSIKFLQGCQYYDPIGLIKYSAQFWRADMLTHVEQALADKKRIAEELQVKQMLIKSAIEFVEKNNHCLARPILDLQEVDALQECVLLWDCLGGDEELQDAYFSKNKPQASQPSTTGQPTKTVVRINKLNEDEVYGRRATQAMNRKSKRLIIKQSSSSSIKSTKSNSIRESTVKKDELTVRKDEQPLEEYDTNIE